ncbi:hypothetical protein M9H77_12399 [Catharanthus roseus]|uniref:Uncharacterized protein n=1 Tax=Catharanthus roseus TaxID=4058 RepID=A0ACC0BH91_CATRO|nr:hypothetical protein M9H77_12399 [Catharanthus roseus]
MSLMIFEGDKREEMKERCCDIISPLNSPSNEEVNLLTNSINHFLACFSLCVQKFEAQDLKNEGSLYYKLYKTISFLPSTSFLSFDFIINGSNSRSFSNFCDRIQSQFFNFLNTTCGTKLNHGIMKAKEKGMGNELSIGYEDTSMSLCLNPFHLYHEFSFEELKLFLECMPLMLL